MTKKKARIYEGCGVSQTPKIYCSREEGYNRDKKLRGLEGIFGNDCCRILVRECVD